MLTAERRQTILDRLGRHGKVVAAELADALGVSEDTVRRDLRELDAQGLLRRVHGGALPPSPTPARYAQRRELDVAGKAAIARAAARLVRTGDVVLVGGGTTTEAFAHALPDDLEATVITTAPAVALALAARPRVEVTVVGGRLHPETRTVVGTDAAECVRPIRADLCVLGVCSLHPDAGLTLHHREEGLVEQAMLDGCARVVTLTGGEKLGTAAPFPVAGVEAITTLVTDRAAPAAMLGAYAAAGIEVVRA
jgi:DeoR/GlpR family transcriptional regulator of sugar metabolism